MFRETSKRSEVYEERKGDASDLYFRIRGSVTEKRFTSIKARNCWPLLRNSWQRYCTIEDGGIPSSIPLGFRPLCQSATWNLCFAREIDENVLWNEFSIVIKYRRRSVYRILVALYLKLNERVFYFLRYRF